MNKWTGHGFTGKDPEIKTLESGKKIAKFSIATTSFRKDKDGKKLTDWHNLIFFDKLAELCEKYVKKGSELIVEGEISYGSYTNKEDVVKYTTDIICHSLEFCGKKESGSAPENNEGKFQKSGKVTTGAMSDINSLPGAVEDELPY